MQQTAPPSPPKTPPPSVLHIVLLCLHLSFSLGFSLSFLLLPAWLLPEAQLALSCLIAWNRLGVWKWGCGGRWGNQLQHNALCITRIQECVCVFHDVIGVCSLCLKEVNKYNQHHHSKKREREKMEKSRIMRHLGRLEHKGSALNFFEHAT